MWSHGPPLEIEVGSALLSLAGESPNDVQHLAYYLWNAANRKPVRTSELRIALNTLLDHQERCLETRLAELTPLQERFLFALASRTTANVASRDFVLLAGANNRAATHLIAKRLTSGEDPLLQQLNAGVYGFRDRYCYLGLPRRLVRKPNLGVLLKLGPLKIDPVLEEFLV